ncbi:MAG: hypothetical protein QXT53_04395 [Ignisphaera sp.]
MRSVTIVSSARIHFGFYNFLDDNIAWGGVGIAIDNPRIIVRVSESEEIKVDNRTNIDVSDVVNAVRDGLGVKGFSVEVLEAYPRHVGLGSTTQLALAIGYAVSLLYDLGLEIRDVAFKLGRGKYSGIGIAAFELGGFIVDSGRVVSSEGVVSPPSNVDDVPYPIYRQRIPKGWIFVVSIIKNAKGCGLNNHDKLLEKPVPLPKDTQLEFYKTLMLYILPSIARKDLGTFAVALTKFQRMVIENLEKVLETSIQCEEAKGVMDIMARHGLIGVGQSIWGPMVYGIYPYHYRKALGVANSITKEAKWRGYRIESFVAEPRASGVEITIARSRSNRTWRLIK